MTKILGKDRITPILEAYVHLVNDIGIENITLQKIAKKAKVSFGKVHYYFGQNQNELLTATILYVGTNAQRYIEAHLSNQSSKEAPVKNYIKGSFNWAKEYLHHSSFWLYYFHLCSRKMLPEDMATFAKLGQLRVERLIVESVGMKFYNLPKDLTAASAATYHLLVGGMLAGRMGGEVGLTKQAKATAAAVDSILKKECF